MDWSNLLSPPFSSSSFCVCVSVCRVTFMKPDVLCGGRLAVGWVKCPRCRFYAPRRCGKVSGEEKIETKTKDFEWSVLYTCMWIDFGDVFSLLYLLFTDFFVACLSYSFFVAGCVSYTDFGVWGWRRKISYKVFAFRFQKHIIDLLAI